MKIKRWDKEDLKKDDAEYDSGSGTMVVVSQYEATLLIRCLSNQLLDKSGSPLGRKEFFDNNGDYFSIVVDPDVQNNKDVKRAQARLDKQDLILRCGKVAVEKGITDPEAIGKMMEFMKYILHDAECQDHRYGRCDCQVKEAHRIYNQAIGKL